MGGVFINYRRGETAGEARALYNELSATLGADSVFMDVDNIALGRDFRQALNERLKSVDVMLALIGKDWAHATNNAGKRRLDDPNDFVRREIRAALERNIAVTPVLLQGAQMPAEAELPEDIRDLAFRNGFELSHTRWSSDVHELLKRLELLPPESHAPDTRPLHMPPAPAPVASAPAPRRRVGMVLAVLAVIGIAGAGAYLYMEHTARVQRVLAQAEAERRRAQLLAEQAHAAAEAASAAAAQAQRERAEAEARAAAAARQRALAEEQARQRSEKEAQARAAAEQRAADAATRAQRQQAERDLAAREQAARDQTAREQAAREQAARDQAAREQAERDQARRDQADRDRAEREQAARDQAAREAAARARSADMEQRMADVRRGKFSGSLGVSLGDFATLRNIAAVDLSAQTASPACGKFAEQVPAEEARNFRALCLWLPEYASRNRMRLGVRPSSTQWMAYCSDRADYVRAEGDARRALLGTCLKYR